MNKDKLWKWLKIVGSVATFGAGILSNVIKDRELKEQVSKQVAEELAKRNGGES